MGRELKNGRRKRCGATTKNTPESVAPRSTTTSSVVGRDTPAKQTREEVAAELEELVCKTCGTKTPAAASALTTQVANLLVWSRPDPKNRLDCLTIPAARLAEIGPETGVEAMLAVQMLGVHEAATAFLQRAQPDKDTGDEAGANVQRAVRLMRLFNEQLAALAKLKGTTSQQKVTVEHVHVHEGGQAIVGAVSPTKAQRVGEGRGDGD